MVEWLWRSPFGWSPALSFQPRRAALAQCLLQNALRALLIAGSGFPQCPQLSALGRGIGFFLAATIS
jgi:hypothetical protein